MNVGRLYWGVGRRLKKIFPTFSSNSRILVTEDRSGSIFTCLNQPTNPHDFYSIKVLQPWELTFSRSEKNAGKKERIGNLMITSELLVCYTPYTAVISLWNCLFLYQCILKYNLTLSCCSLPSVFDNNHCCNVFREQL